MNRARRRSIFSLVVALATLSLLSSGAGAPLMAPPAPATRHALDRLWVSSQGGYGSIGSFTDATLYSTAWNVRLANEYRIPLPDLDRTGTTTWLVEYLSNPQASPLPHLETARLTIQALSDLGERVDPSAIEAIVRDAEANAEALFVGEDPLRPDWANADTFDQLLGLAGQPRPRWFVEAMAQADPPTVPVGTSAIEQAERLLPWWKLRPMGDEDKGRLPELWTLLTETPAESGAVLALLGELKVAAAANGVVLGPIPSGFYAPLEMANGYLSFAAGVGDPEPHVTALAAELGRPLPEALGGSMRSSMGPHGWTEQVSDPTPESTFLGLMVQQAVAASAERTAAVAALAETWRDELFPQLRNIEQIRQALRQTFYLVVLLQRTGGEVSVPPRYLSELEKASLEGWSRDEARTLVRLALVWGLAFDRERQDEVVALAVGGDVTTMADAYAAWCACQLTGDANHCDSARRAAERLRDDRTGAHRAAKESPLPDLEATTLAAIIRSEPVEDRVLRQFADSFGVWMLPIGSHANNIINLGSAFDALVATDPDSLGLLVP